MIKRLLLIATAIGGVIALARRVGLKEYTDWRDAHKPGRIIDIAGYGVHIVERGSGPRALLLIHGFGAHTYSWRELMPRFERDYRIIAVDLKGFGYSERDAGAGLSATDQVAMLKALLDHLGIERAVVAGHSMGGGIAQRFAATYPQMVAALILIASVAGDEREGIRTLPAFIMRPLMPVLGALTASRLLAACYEDRAFLTPEIREAYLGPTRIRGSMDGLLAMLRDTASDPPIDTSRIDMPVLVLVGEHDRVVPRSASQRIRERIPQARVVVIERAGHNLIEERPDDCAEAIRAFLREAAPAAPAASASV